MGESVLEKGNCRKPKSLCRCICIRLIRRAAHAASGATARDGTSVTSHASRGLTHRPTPVPTPHAASQAKTNTNHRG